MKMMRKLLLLAIVILVAAATGSVCAKVRTISEAQSVAMNHFATQKSTRSVSAKIIQTISASDILPQRKTRIGDGGEPFYVFVSSAGTHVIVSGDDRMSPILGYSDAGFDKNKVNPALRDLLTIYGLAYDEVQATGVPAVLAAPRSATRALKPSVAPLLNGIAYGQERPFNLMSPRRPNGELGYTGCVATAMAMIMRYYKYPNRAFGVGGGPNFRPGNDIELGKQPLEWDKILPNNGGTNENHMAVSWLMRCVGAAVNMIYQNSSSGAGAHDIPRAFADNFLYDENVRVADRDGYTLSQWADMARTELSAGRPMVYNGLAMNASEGHSFVMDGYDEKGLFSVNWGYEGHPEWYAISGVGRYTTGETAIVGIKKPLDDGEYVSCFARSSSTMNIPESKIDRNGTFNVTKERNYANRGGTFTGNIGLVLYKDGAVAAVLGTVAVDKLPRNNQVDVEYKNVSIPSTIAPGRYQLHAASKDNREKVWQKLEMNQEMLPYYQVDITTSEITFSNPVNKNAAKVVKFSINPEKVHFKDDVDFIAEVQNDGSEWAGYFILRFTNLNTGVTDDPYFHEQWKSILVPGVNTIKRTKYMGLDPGEYRVDLLHSFDGASNWVPLPGFESKIFTLHTENYGKYDYYVVANYCGIEKSTVTNKEGRQPRVIVELSCVGAKDIENGKFTVMIRGGTLPYPLFLPVPVSIKKGETRRIVLETGVEIPDGDGYEWHFESFNPPDGSADLVVPGLQRSYRFSVRTLENGK